MDGNGDIPAVGTSIVGDNQLWDGREWDDTGEDGDNFCRVQPSNLHLAPIIINVLQENSRIQLLKVGRDMCSVVEKYCNR